MSPHTPRSRVAGTLAGVVIALAAMTTPPATADEEQPPPADGGMEVAQIEDYAGYDGQTACHPKPRKGTRMLAAYLLETYGGGGGATGRACGGGASEHKDGRAIDWSMNAASKSDRQVVKTFLKDAFATDEDGNEHALARRMGIMYIIWNDTMYSAWDHFDPEPYLSSSCRSVKRCSKTLRHRDHVHISLSKLGAKAKTSWYAPPEEQPQEEPSA